MSDWYTNVSPRYLKYLNSKEWKQKRAEVIKRCNNICEHCGKLQVHEIHHTSYAKLYDEPLSDLQGLCMHCHDFLHGKSESNGSEVAKKIIAEIRKMEFFASEAVQEIERFESRKSVYQSFKESDFKSHKEIIALFRQHRKYRMQSGIGEIINVRYAKRKFDPAIALNIRFLVDEERIGTMTIGNANQMLFAQEFFLDIERDIWIDIRETRSIIRLANRRIEELQSQLAN